MAQQKLKKKQKIKKNDNVFSELNKEDTDFIHLGIELDSFDDISQEFTNDYKD